MWEILLARKSIFKYEIISDKIIVFEIYSNNLTFSFGDFMLKTYKKKKVSISYLEIESYKDILYFIL